jgi:hypothetical protein
LADDYLEIRAEFDSALFACVRAGHLTQDERAKEYLLNGVGRRLGVLRECLASIFETFPPARSAPLSLAGLYQVQINLHAFVINLSGLFDNLAWAFVLRHGLLEKIGGRKRVGMFLQSTQQVLPVPLATYVTSATMTTWHGSYLKAYRDALAHRIPLYVPPATFTPQEQQRYANSTPRNGPQSLHTNGSEWSRCEARSRVSAKLVLFS